MPSSNGRSTLAVVSVEWMEAPASVEAYVALCQDCELPADAYPAAERVTRLMRRCRRILLGVFEDGSEPRRLVGAVVMLPILPHIAQELDEAARVAGGEIEGKDLRRRWRRDGRQAAYISSLVAAPGYEAVVLRAVMARIWKHVRVTKLYTRASTAGGRSAAKALGLAPLARRSPIWSATAPPHPDDSTGRYRRMRLGRVDRVHVGTERVLAVSKRVGAVIAIAVLVAFLAIPWPQRVEAFPGIARMDGSTLAGLVAATVALGALTLTMMVLTGQLRVSGVRDYGLSSLYRYRDVVPLVVSTGIAGLAGILAIALGEPDPNWWVLLGGVSVIAQCAVVVFSFLGGLEMVMNMDPVSIARRFARRIRPSDANDWGLVEVAREADGSVRVTLRTHRTNFGLRDPLMPTHELLMSANAQRYGQILSVLAGRVANAYGLRWATQFPDPDTWDLVSTRSRAGVRERAIAHGWLRGLALTSSGRGRRSEERLQLVMLILHYFRRVHRNPDSLVQRDRRRQAAQFVLARLALVLARGPVTPDATEGEVEVVLDLVTDTVLRIAADFAPGAIHAADRPAFAREDLNAFGRAVAAMHHNGHDRAARHATQTLRWLMNHGAVSRQRLAGAIEQVSRLPRLRRLITDARSKAAPAFVRASPWGQDLAAGSRTFAAPTAIP